MHGKQRLKVSEKTKKGLSRSGRIGISYDDALSELLDLKESIESQLSGKKKSQN